MTKALQRLALLALFLCCVLLPLQGAQAMDMGVRNEIKVDYTLVPMGPNATIANLLDWLDDFLEDEIGYILQASTDLSRMFVKLDEVGYTGSYQQDGLAIFTNLKAASDLDAEMSYYFDQFSYAYERCAFITHEITSGSLSPERQRELLQEKTKLEEETKRLRQSAMGKIGGWQNATTALINNLDPDQSPYIGSIRAAVQKILHDEARGKMAAEADPRVTVISDKEIGLSVEDQRGKRVKGVAITVRSQANGVERTMTTNDNGAAVFWVADFKPDRNGDICVEVTYEGNGVGLRRREFGLMDMRGGDSFHTILAADNGKPYLIRATFDGYDMINIKNGMYVTPGNNINHSIQIKADCKGKDRKFDLWQYTDGWKVDWKYLIRDTVKDKQLYTYTKPWVQKGQREAFLVGEALYLTLDGADNMAGDSAVGARKDKSAYDTPKAKHEAKKGKEKESSGLNGALGFTLPADWPIIGGAQLKFPFESGLQVYYEVGKSLKLGYNWPIKPDSLSWQSEDMKKQDERLKKESKEQAGALSKTIKGIKSQYAAHKKEKFLATSEASITPYVYIYLERDEKSNTATGEFCNGVIFAYNYEFTNQFMLGPVPAFIGLDFGISLNIGLGLGATGDVDSKTDEIKNLRFSGSTGFLFNPHVELGITVGAGLPRIAYVALRGCGWLDMTVVLGPKAEPAKAQTGLRAEVTVKILFFSKTWKLWEKIWPENLSPYQYYSFASSLANGNRYDPSDFLSVEEADAISGNYAPGIPTIVENATEINEIMDMPTNGINVKYATFTSGNQSYNVALWLGTATPGRDERTKIFYKVLGDSSGVKLLPNPPGYDTNQYTIDYDFDYTLSKLGVFSIRSDKPEEAFNEKATEDEIAALMAGRSRDHSGLAVIYNFDFGSKTFKVDGSNYRKYDWVGYTPRARFLRDMPNYLAVGATEVYWFQNKITYRVSAGLLQELRSSTTLSPYEIFPSDQYHMPDMQLMDVCYGPYPIVISMAQSRASKTVSRLVINSMHAQGNITLDIPNINSNMMLPIREKYSGGGSTGYQHSGFMLLKSSGSGVGQNAIFNEVSVAYFDSNRQSDLRRNNPNALKESLKKFAIKDMGVKVSADGLRTVNVNVNGENQLYAYWLQGFSDAKVQGKNDYTERYSIMASLIDTKKKLATPAFEWVALQKMAGRIHIMTVEDVKKPVTAYYVHTKNVYGTIGYGMQKLTFPLTVGVRLHTFATEYPVVCQGKPFHMYFRFENTGSLVIRSVDVDVIANKIGGSGAQEVPIKGIHIVLDTPKGGGDQNKITHYDFRGTGQLTAPETVGDYAVYQIPDIMDDYSGKTVITREYTDWSSYINERSATSRSSPLELIFPTAVADQGVPYASPRVEEVLGMLPGNIVTFKSQAIISPMAWHGEYTLKAEVKKIGFTMSLGSMADGEKPILYTAERQTDGSFAVTATSDTSGTTDHLPDMVGNALLAYFADSTSAKTDAGESMGNAALNNARNETLTKGDTVFANIDYNDVELSVEPQLIEGVEYVLITLSNDSYPCAPESIPKLVASVDGKITFTHAFKTDLKSGFNRSIFLPLAELTSGLPYEDLALNVVSATGKEYFEVNPFTDKAKIAVSADFGFIKQPVDQTVFAGQDATFAVEVGGGSGNYSYQWQQRKLDGTYADIHGATGSTLTLVKAPLLLDGYAYWCMVTDTTLKQKVMSDVAYLTVVAAPPVTGDAFSAEWIALFAALSASAVIILLYRMRRRHSV